MKEILAENLQSLFDNTELTGKCTYKSKRYEIWEVSDEVFNAMDMMSEEEFESLCTDGMWRYSDGSIFGTPDVEYEINKKILKAWDDKREKYIREDCTTCQIKELHNCQQTEEDYIECFGSRRYENLLEYLCEEIGASQPRNICALAMDLAKANNMTMGELFREYEG